MKIQTVVFIDGEKFTVVGEVNAEGDVLIHEVRNAADRIAEPMQTYHCSACGKQVRGDSVTVEDCQDHPLATIAIKISLLPFAEALRAAWKLTGGTQ